MATGVPIFRPTQGALESGGGFGELLRGIGEANIPEIIRQENERRKREEIIRQEQERKDREFAAELKYKYGTLEQQRKHQAAIEKENEKRTELTLKKMEQDSLKWEKQIQMDERRLNLYEKQQGRLTGEMDRRIKAVDAEMAAQNMIADVIASVGSSDPMKIQRGLIDKYRELKTPSSGSTFEGRAMLGAFSSAIVKFSKDARRGELKQEDIMRDRFATIKGLEEKKRVYNNLHSIFTERGEQYDEIFGEMNAAQAMKYMKEQADIAAKQRYTTASTEYDEMQISGQRPQTPGQQQMNQTANVLNEMAPGAFAAPGQQPQMQQPQVAQVQAQQGGMEPERQELIKRVQEAARAQGSVANVQLIMSMPIEEVRRRLGG